MKNLKILNYFFLLLIVVSCTYDESPLDEDIVGQNVGAVLTTISTSGALVNKNNPPDDDFSSTVYFNDFANNDTMESVDVYLLFVDTTPVNNQVLTLDEALVGTISASDFTLGESGYPEHTFTINNGTMLDTFNLTDVDIEGGDLFILRYVLNLTDGRSFSAQDIGTNVSTTSHNAPFRYSSSVVCFKAPDEGDWELTMEDLYGDGWNGGKIIVSIDGVETEYVCSGSFTSETITVPANTARFLFTYVAGDWEGENLYTLKNPSGEIILEDGTGDFSRTNGPAEGEQFNTCD